MTRIALAFAALLGLAACETVDGFGQDVQAAGQGISEVAGEVQEDI
ncbi:MULTISPECIES: entericidin A/B family lipoprotein [Paracoccaceae]|jgi:predicted small secreted protein|nr:entericidin A/B family lipoprotein [Boseongicola sp. H5]MBO6602513.1 entericidin A/B family lipoprotein [Roseicyclus sp.]MBO6624764.1 entericidin A/B family lipoprotein [Roseicyclus sp.]MBO6921484.1 entericidin A/B family lipoprotein [Roseicyclus sp.]